MGTIRRRLLSAVAVIGLAAGVGVAVSGGGAGATFYYYTPGATPSSADAGTDTAIAVTFANYALSFSKLNYAKVTVPSGLQAIGATASQGTLTQTGNVIEVKNANLAQGKTLTITVNTRFPCAATGTQYTWVTEARTGTATSSKFIPKASDPKTTIAGACKLAFAGQPADATAKQPITTAAFDTGAAPVSVQVLSGATTPSVATSAWTQPITLTAGSVTPSNNVATPGAGNVATFPGLSIDTAGDYTLAASTPGLAGATSNQFHIDLGGTFTCTASDSQACATPVLTGPTGSNIQITVNDFDTVTTNITVDFTDTLAQQYPCPSPTPETLVTDPVQFSSSSQLSGLTKSVTLVGTAADGVPEWDYQACFVADYDFPALPASSTLEQENQNLSQALFDPGYSSQNNAVEVAPGIFQGILLNCDSGFTADQPCVASRAIAAGKITVVLTVPAKDPATYLKR